MKKQKKEKWITPILEITKSAEETLTGMFTALEATNSPANDFKAGS